MRKEGQGQGARRRRWAADSARRIEQLRLQCGLTGAEAEIARLLLDGQCVEGAAAARGVSVHTVRAQLKRVFRKTGTHRQTDLLRLLLLPAQRGRGAHRGAR